MPACRFSVVCLFLLASAALAIGGAHAQTSSAPQPPQQYKFSTRIPPGVAIPDKVETRLGTLKFFDGFPDEATVEKLYDNLDFQRAVQAYLLALPPVNQVANRKGILEVGPANTTVPIFETMMNARSIFLTAEQQHAVHLVLARPAQRPAGRRGPAEGPRADQRHVVSLCHRCRHHRAGQGRGRQVPAAAARLQGRGARRATSWCGRRRSASGSPGARFLENGDPKPGVDRVKKFTKIYPLSQAANPPTLNFVNVSGQGFQHGRPGRLSVLGVSQPGGAGGADASRSTRSRWASGPPSASRRASPSLPMRG